MTAHNRTANIREKIIQNTDDLLYEKGFNQMSFTDISRVSKVPRGNINYHFKTKNDVLQAVIEYRVGNIKTMLKEWDQTLKTPLLCLKRFAQVPLNEKDRVTQFGCPMGTLNAELGKTQEPLQKLAKEQMDVFKEWIQQKFLALASKDKAPYLTEQLLIRSQGISMLAQIYRDDSIIERGVQDVENWLDELV